MQRREEDEVTRDARIANNIFSIKHGPDGGLEANVHPRHGVASASSLSWPLVDFARHASVLDRVRTRCVFGTRSGQTAVDQLFAEPGPPAASVRRASRGRAVVRTAGQRFADAVHRRVLAVRLVRFDGRFDPGLAVRLAGTSRPGARPVPGVRRPRGPYAIRAIHDLPGPAPGPLGTVFDVVDQMKRVLELTVLDPSGRSLLVRLSVRPTRRRVSTRLL